MAKAQNEAAIIKDMNSTSEVQRTVLWLGTRPSSVFIATKINIFLSKNESIVEGNIIQWMKWDWCYHKICI